MSSYEALKGNYEIWMNSYEALKNSHKMGKYRREIEEGERRRRFELMQLRCG